MATGRVPTTANSPLTAKGDLFGYSTTQARVPVGSDGETLVADSSASTGLRWQNNFAAGKNKFINGDFSIWQRGTSFTIDTGKYTADRWYDYSSNPGGSNVTTSQQTFTPGAAPVSGYEGTYFMRVTKGSGTGTGANAVGQRIEDVRIFANQTVTLSYWAKVGSGTVTNEPTYIQNFGSGGSTQIETGLTAVTITTTWTRFSHVVSIPSVSGKTIGAGSYLAFLPMRTLGTGAVTFDLWGVQVEAGNTATAFQTATGTLAGELHVCKRYYEKSYNIGTTPGTNTGTGSFYYGGTTNVSNNVFFQIPFSAEKRGTPTMTFYTTSGTSGQLTYARSGVGATNATATAYQTGTTGSGVYVGAGAQYVACELGGHWVAEAEL